MSVDIRFSILFYHVISKIIMLEIQLVSCIELFDFSTTYWVKSTFVVP